MDGGRCAIRRETRRTFSADEKIRIVRGGLVARAASRICAAAETLKLNETVADAELTTSTF